MQHRVEGGRESLCGTLSLSLGKGMWWCHAVRNRFNHWFSPPLPPIAVPPLPSPSSSPRALSPLRSSCFPLLFSSTFLLSPLLSPLSGCLLQTRDDDGDGGGRGTRGVYYRSITTTPDSFLPLPYPPPPSPLFSILVWTRRRKRENEGRTDRSPCLLSCRLFKLVNQWLRHTTHGRYDWHHVLSFPSMRPIVECQQISTSTPTTTATTKKKY